MNTETKVRVLTARWHKHNGQQMKVGDEYETDEANALDLVQMGYVTRVAAPAAGRDAKGRYLRRDMEAEE